VAFDIPAETVRFIVDQLKDKGRVTRGAIGVLMQTVTPTIAEAIGLNVARGALVAQIDQDSPAAKSGVQVGDVILSVNGNEAKDSRELARTIAGIAPDTPTSFVIFRDGQEKSMVVKVGELPLATEAKTVAATEIAALGLTFAPAHAVAVALEKGVVVMDVSSEGAAADSGLQVGDVIISVSGFSVNAPSDVTRIVVEARVQSKRAILLQFIRDEISGFVAIPIT
jgi:serine protease Do